MTPATISAAMNRASADIGARMRPVMWSAHALRLDERGGAYGAKAFVDLRSAAREDTAANYTMPAEIVRVPPRPPSTPRDAVAAGQAGEAGEAARGVWGGDGAQGGGAGPTAWYDGAPPLTADKWRVLDRRRISERPMTLAHHATYTSPEIWGSGWDAPGARDDPLYAENRAWVRAFVRSPQSLRGSERLWVLLASQLHSGRPLAPSSVAMFSSLVHATPRCVLWRAAATEDEITWAEALLSTGGLGGRWEPTSLTSWGAHGYGGSGETAQSSSKLSAWAQGRARSSAPLATRKQGLLGNSGGEGWRRGTTGARLQNLAPLTPLFVDDAGRAYALRGGGGDAGNEVLSASTLPKELWLVVWSIGGSSGASNARMGKARRSDDSAAPYSQGAPGELALAGGGSRGVLEGGAGVGALWWACAVPPVPSPGERLRLHQNRFVWRYAQGARTFISTVVRSSLAPENRAANSRDGAAKAKPALCLVRIEAPESPDQAMDGARIRVVAAAEAAEAAAG